MFLWTAPSGVWSHVEDGVKPRRSQMLHSHAWWNQWRKNLKEQISDPEPNFLSDYQAWGSSLSPREPFRRHQCGRPGQLWYLTATSGSHEYSYQLNWPHMMDRSEKDEMKVKVKSSKNRMDCHICNCRWSEEKLRPALPPCTLIKVNRGFCSLLFWFCASGKLFRTSGEMYLTDKTGSCVTSCLHISAVTWREQPPDQMAGRPLI